MYQTTPSGAQIEAQKVDPGVTASHQIKVENDSGTNRSFVVKATESGATGFTMTYRAGSTDITAALLGGGYTTPVLSPGASVIITLTATPGRALAASLIRDSILRVFRDGSDTTTRDAVQARTVVQGTGDLLIKLGKETDSAFALDNVYQSVPAGAQARAQGIEPGEDQVYHVRVENDSDTSRSLIVKAAESSGDGWSLRYLRAGTEITGVITGPGYTTAILPPGGGEVLVVVVTANSSIAAGQIKDTTLRVFLTGTDATVRDAVRARTFVNPNADLLIKLSSEPASAFQINNVYQSVPAGAQVRNQTVAAGSTVTYQVKVENDGPVDRTFVVKATGASGDGWTIKYRSGATDITADVLGAGYVTGVLAPGASEVLAVEVTPSSAASGDFRDVVLNVFLNGGDPTVRDAVRARTTVQ